MLDLDVSMMPATVASMTKNMGEVGHRTATMFLVVSVTALTVSPFPLVLLFPQAKPDLLQGTPLTGAIIVRENGSYIGAFCASGVFVLVVSAINAASWWVVSREKGTKWV